MHSRKKHREGAEKHVRSTTPTSRKSAALEPGESPPHNCKTKEVPVCQTSFAKQADYFFSPLINTVHRVTLTVAPNVALPLSAAPVAEHRDPLNNSELDRTSPPHDIPFRSNPS